MHIWCMLYLFDFCLLYQVIAKLEGPAVSQYCALRLLQVISCSNYSSHIFPVLLLWDSRLFCILQSW